MKRIISLFLLLQLFVSCNGLNNKSVYSQKSESGLNGSVKRVTKYICPVKNDKIPTDTTHYTARITTTYDREGNFLTENNFYNLEPKITEYLTTYSGKGKNRTYVQKSIQGDLVADGSYKYVWLDDYHFKVVPSDTGNTSGFVIESRLDKDFRIIKSIYKMRDTIRLTDEFEYVIKNNKVQETIHKRMVDEGDNKRIINQVIVSQEFDQQGNPTLIYIYSRPDKQQLQNVTFMIYEYYED
ncbi:MULTISPECIES: hypothetical protein [Chryseobacterium]|uniref:hypothetical protein n=1 Tax=Chryseobacterium sp. R2A-55 TaxID=2744445 RepID=UPI001F36406D|nr:hypothetical protein [Chryseobacterium sp. R2A-55]